MCKDEELKKLKKRVRKLERQLGMTKTEYTNPYDLQEHGGLVGDLKRNPHLRFLM